MSTPIIPYLPVPAAVLDHMRRLELGHSLRRSAIHESGHAVAATVLGGKPARVVIWQSTAQRYSGITNYKAPDDAHFRAVCAIAGGAAETLAFCHDDADKVAAALDRMSNEDAINAGDISAETVRATLEFCRICWATITERARGEAEQARRLVAFDAFADRLAAPARRSDVASDESEVSFSAWMRKRRPAPRIGGAFA